VAVRKNWHAMPRKVNYVQNSGNYKIQSNFEGKIKSVILHYGGFNFTPFDHDLTLFYRELMEKMDPDVGFVIITGNDDKAAKLKDTLTSYKSVKLPDGTARLKYLKLIVKTGYSSIHHIFF